MFLKTDTVEAEKDPVWADKEKFIREMASFAGYVERKLGAKSVMTFLV